jgi:hypothetical protein
VRSIRHRGGPGRPGGGFWPSGRTKRHLAVVLGEYVIHYNGIGRTGPGISGHRRSTQPVRDAAGLADLRSIRRKPIVGRVINKYHHTA